MPGVHRRRVKLRPQRVLQLAAAALFNGYALGFGTGRIFTGPSKGICVPVLNCYSCPGALGACPIGSLQSALGGANRHFPFYILGTLMLFGVLLGRGVCGLLCPFGLVQDLIHKIPLPKWTVPQKLDRPARLLKYGVLVGMVLLAPLLATGMAALPAFCKYLCPAGTLEGGLPLLASNPSLRQAAGALFGWKLLLLLLILAACVFIHRPFCKYLCPLGALYGLFNRFSFLQLRLDPEKCTGCNQCQRSCPMGVEITAHPHSAECIRCGTCKAACPSGALSLRAMAAKEPQQEQPGDQAK